MRRMGNGQDVRAAQEALKDKGFDPGKIDGRMGPRTQAAISEFQRSAGLRETGRFDQATRSQLGIGSSGTSPTGLSNQPGTSASDSNNSSQPANRPSGR
jgi:peptidoglycan hydrolase-like protein with peptidoglycan-binding domain